MNAGFRTGLLTSAFAAAATLGACSGSGSPTAPLPSQITVTSAPLGGAAQSVPYGNAMLQGATLIGPAKLARVGADLWMQMSDEAGLLSYARAANDPASPEFRHWLTPQQLGDRFGAPAATYAATAKYLASQGLGVNTYPQRQMISVNGPQAAVERTLGISFGVYRLGSRTFVAPIGTARPNASLRIAQFGGVVGYSKRSRRNRLVRASSSLQNGYSAQQIAQGFDYNGAYAAGYAGDGITIGIIGTGPITDGDPRIPYGDVKEYKTLFGLSGTGTVVQDIDLSTYASPSLVTQSGLQTPPPATSPTTPGCVAQMYSQTNQPTNYTTCNPEDLEAQLDTEQASSLAPNATVNFYIAYNPSECYGTCGTPMQELGLGEADNEISKAIADDASDVISMSYGEDEADSISSGYLTSSGTGPEPDEFASLASEGIAVLASSGDNGAEECYTDGGSMGNEPCVNYPATDPNVTSIGGVNAPFDNSGRLTGPITGWGEATQIEGAPPGASGGGCSIVFTEPAYGTGAGLPCGGMRTQPDVSLDADTQTGVAVVIDTAPVLGGRTIEAVGGTSVSAPEFAAMWALVLEACSKTPSCGTGTGTKSYRLGNPNDYMYPIYETALPNFPNGSEYEATFYDVLFGNNSLPSTSGSGQDSGFTAGQGYDAVTGIGVPYALHLAQNVVACAVTSGCPK